MLFPRLAWLAFRRLDAWAALVVAQAAAVSLGVDSHARAQGYPPAEAVARMQPAAGVEVALFAAEPEVRQPILVKCDDRGRLWTIQYLQYPNPAGLTRVAVDRWSRTVYDRVPEPPPHGPRGADRITICADRDGDGRADEFRDFVAGLNLATGLEFGHGGVYVLQAPYLLFYPDRNRDDVPDGDPEVLLTGFGLEDAQSLANHLTWGPDGWLYGVNGSTTTSRIRGYEFQQGVWRYHPQTREFELWCEGGSNTYGLTFDDRGRLLYSTNGGPFVHGVGGGLFYKSFAKHGPLHHRFAYHHFPQLECDQVPGGPPTGGTILASAQWGEPWRDAFVAGNFLGHTVGAWRVEPSGSTVRARWLDTLIDSRDTWFGATDVCLGPAGELYVSDFHDQRTAHPDPDAQWDRSNGRIYRLTPTGARAAPHPLDLATWGDDPLAGALDSTEGWLRYRARAELATRDNPALGRRLAQRALDEPDTPRALESLWGAHLLRGLDEAETLALLSHADPWRRAWSVRLAADDREVSPRLAAILVRMVPTEEALEVLVELAVAARRLPSEAGWPLVAALVDRQPDTPDERVDWLTWWALEWWAEPEREAIVSRFADPAAWRHAGWRAHRLRLVRRYAAEGSPGGYGACLTLLGDLPASDEDAALGMLLAGLRERGETLEEIGQGDLFNAQAAPRTSGAAPPSPGEPLAVELSQWIQDRWRADPHPQIHLDLALVAQLPGAVEAWGELLGNPNVDPLTARAHWAAAARNFPLLTNLDWNALLKAWLDAPSDEAIDALVVEAVGQSSDPAVAETLVARWSDLPRVARDLATKALLSRHGSAVRLLTEVEAGRIAAAEVSLDALRPVALFDDPALSSLVTKHWGNIGPGTAEEKLAVMRRLANDLRAGSGDPARGQELFRKHCAVCHRLFGEGNAVGPDLTTANRHDRGALLANLVDPSAVVRREYLGWVLETTSGQVLTGLLVAEDGASITLVDAQGRRQSLARSDIASLAESPVSLMPERLLEPLSPEELRDLFSYLER